MLFPPDGLGIAADGGIAPIGDDGGIELPASRRVSSSWFS
jgi:hypothetical protein